MEPTLKREIDGAEFKETRRGGYDRGEVDDFLDHLADEVGRLEMKASQASDRARAAEARLNQLESDLEAEVQHRLASRAPAAAAAPTGPSEEESAEQLKRTLVLAQRTADAAIKEARDESARLVSEAEAKGRALVDDANAEAVRLRDQTEGETRRQRAEARESLVIEIQKLESTRETLRTDVEKLEEHLGTQRSQLKADVERLQKLVEEPKAFDVDPAPQLTEIEMPLEDEPLPPKASEPPPPPPPPPVARPATPAAEPRTEPAPPPSPGVSRPSTGSVRIDAPRADAPRPSGGSAGGFEEVDHEAPGTSARRDPGPPTKPVSAVELGVDDDAEESDPFLAELRKAMDDDEPLGPASRSESSGPPGLFDQDDSAKKGRFGRRAR